MIGIPESSSRQSEIADEQSEPIQGLSAWKPEGSVQMPSARLVLPNTEGSRWVGEKKFGRSFRKKAPIARPRTEEKERRELRRL